jgi:hypothetical protein
MILSYLQCFAAAVKLVLYFIRSTQLIKAGTNRGGDDLQHKTLTCSANQPQKPPPTHFHNSTKLMQLHKSNLTICAAAMTEADNCW